VAGLSGVNPPARHTISQAAGATASCEYGLTSPQQETFGAGGGSARITLTHVSGGGCTWTAASTVSWITVLDPAGSGNIVIRYNVAENTSTSSRQGRIEVRWPGPQLGQNILVSQAGR